MLWAIDVGNTQTVVGLWDGEWKAIWRLGTSYSSTEDELASLLKPLCDLAQLPFAATEVVVASVVPALDFAINRLCCERLGADPLFLRQGAQVGLQVDYDPKHAVGADRIANALAALEIESPPMIVVDFGTATTFDAISREGRYVGGAILPGVQVSMEALVGRTAKLPQINLAAPKHAVGHSTVESLQSGIMLGTASAIDGLIERMRTELGGGLAIATGGLSEVFMGLCERLDRWEPSLTLDGLRLSAPRLREWHASHEAEDH